MEKTKEKEESYPANKAAKSKKVGKKVADKKKAKVKLSPPVEMGTAGPSQEDWEESGKEMEVGEGTVESEQFEGMPGPLNGGYPAPFVHPPPMDWWGKVNELSISFGTDVYASMLWGASLARPAYGR